MNVFEVNVFEVHVLKCTFRSARFEVDVFEVHVLKGTFGSARLIKNAKYLIKISNLSFTCTAVQEVIFMLGLPSFPGSWPCSDDAARVVIVICRKGYLGIASSTLHAQCAVLKFGSAILGQ